MGGLAHRAVATQIAQCKRQGTGTLHDIGHDAHTAAGGSGQHDGHEEVVHGSVVRQNAPRVLAVRGTGQAEVPGMAVHHADQINTRACK